jgi:hypothetical protein
MTNMPSKIDRKKCLAEYPEFPLREYDEVADEDIYHYPEVISGDWLKLNVPDDEAFSMLLANELAELLRSLGIKTVFFLGDTEQCWISPLALTRLDYTPFVNSVHYFNSLGVDQSFNGALAVEQEELSHFLSGFYVLVRCDASLPYFHFIDDKRQYVGTLHYSGQIRLDSLSEEAHKKLPGNLSNTRFMSVTE